MQSSLPAGLVVIVTVTLSACQSLSLKSASLTPSSVAADSASHLRQEVSDWLSHGPIPIDSATEDPKATTFNVNAVQVPLDSLLFAMSRDAGLELTLHQPVSQPVTLRASSPSLFEILDRLSLQADFRWQLNGRHLDVWGADPYSESYAVDYLNMQRATSSSVGLATEVGTINASDARASGIANSSSTRIENRAEHHFWQSLSTDLDAMLVHIGDAGTRYSINKEAGLLTLHGVPTAHRRVTRYLESLQASANRQVLIEATVVEVTLSDRFEAGIDWQLLSNSDNGLSAAQVLLGAPAVTRESVDRIPAGNGLVSLVSNGGLADVTATLSLLEQFGDVRILSRPRIIALNNQSSVLKVVDNRVYFTVNVERRQSEERDEVTTETEIHTVPVGLVMNVTPQISSDGYVMLNVRPSMSRILGFVDDPNPELAVADVRNSVPEIQVREMESMLRVHSGDVAIIGGLMQESTGENISRLPGLGRVPVIGKLFASVQKNRSQTELMIVLRPTVMPSLQRLKAF